MTKDIPPKDSVAINQQAITHANKWAGNLADINGEIAVKHWQEVFYAYQTGAESQYEANNQKGFDNFVLAFAVGIAFAVIVVLIVYSITN